MVPSPTMGSPAGSCGALLLGILVAACRSQSAETAAPRPEAAEPTTTVEATQDVPEVTSEDEAFDMLRSPSAAARIAGLRFLCWRLPIRGREEEAVRVIQPMLRDRNAVLRELATTAIGRMSAAALPAVPTLLAALQSDSQSERAQTARALRRIGISGEMEVPLLSATENTTVPEFRVELVLALGEVPGSPEAVVRRLADLLRDRAPSVRRAARIGLARAGPSAAIVVDELTTALETPACGDAVALLANLGSAAGAAVPTLFGLLDDTSGCNARAVAAAIHAIRGEPAAEGLP